MRFHRTFSLTARSAMFLPLSLGMALTLLAAPLTRAAAGESITVSSQHHALKVETLADGLEHPWGLAFLPGGRMLVTERAGRVRLVRADGSVSAPLEGAPEDARPRPGRHARHRARSGFLRQRPRLHHLCRHRGRQRRHRGMARQARRDRPATAPRRRHDDLPHEPSHAGAPALRLAHRLRPRQDSVDHHRRPWRKQPRPGRHGPCGFRPAHGPRR